MRKTVSILFSLVLALGLCLMATPVSAAVVTSVDFDITVSADDAVDAGNTGVSIGTVTMDAALNDADGNTAIVLVIQSGDYQWVGVGTADDGTVDGKGWDSVAGVISTTTTANDTLTFADTGANNVAGVTVDITGATIAAAVGAGIASPTDVFFSYDAAGAGIDITNEDIGNVTEVAGAVTQLVITQQPAGSVSGVALVTQPKVAARDQFGNTNTTYVTDVVASENDPGALTGTTTIAPVLGVATFTNLVYTATANHEIFQIDFNSGALPQATSNDVNCNVVATKLVFTQQPAGSVSGAVLTTQPIVAAQDANNVTDTDYVTNVVASENDPGALTGTTTIAPVLGVATFTDLVYTATTYNETFQIDVASGVLTGATSNDVVCTVPSSGGGGMPTNSGEGSMSLTPYLNGQGEAICNINLTSTNGLVTINILFGTLVLNAQGNPLVDIQIVVLSTPPPPPGYVLVGHAYDCLPAGATFKPTIILTFKYAEADIPAGVSEQDLVLAYWNGGDQWVNLPTTINAVNNTATARVAHFTPFAILASTGTAAFGASDLSITPAEVDIGQEVTISVLVANTGDAAGNYEVTLDIDNVVVVTKAVTLAAGTSERVTFTTAKDVAGTYAVSVGDLSGTFVVKQAAPPALPPEEAPPEAEESQPLNIWIVVGIIVAVIVVVLAVVMPVRGRRRA